MERKGFKGVSGGGQNPKQAFDDLINAPSGISDAMDRFSHYDPALGWRPYKATDGPSGIRGNFYYAQLKEAYKSCRLRPIGPVHLQRAIPDAILCLRIWAFMDTLHLKNYPALLH